MTVTPEIPLVEVTLSVCTLCLEGRGGECHSPGCVFWVCPAPTAEQAQRIRERMQR